VQGGRCIAQDEEAEDYKEVDYGRRVAFDVEDEVEGVAGGLWGKLV
jgi:hypothetical protein